MSIASSILSTHFAKLFTDIYIGLIISKKSKHDVMFESPYLIPRGNSVRKWFVREILFFFEHRQGGKKRFLVYTQVMKKHTTSEIDITIPMVKTSKIPKISVVAVEDIICPIGLAPSSSKWYKVACNDAIFENYMSKSAGSIINL